MAPGRQSYAVIGDPVEHSLSPRIFARFAQETGLPLHYTALRVRPDELGETVRGLRHGPFGGLSVTLPHKEAILPLLDDLHPLATRIGAVNCVSRTPEGRTHGYNTDAAGFRLALERSGRRLAAARVVLLGAGGAARSAAFAAVDAGAKSLAIVNRNLQRATALGLELCKAGHAWPEGELLRLFGKRPAGDPSGRSFVIALPLDRAAVAQALLHADIVVNATSVGLEAPEDDPLPAGIPLHSGLTLLDMVYRPLETAFLRRGSEAGATTVDGLWMLVEQAAEQLRIWTGARLPADRLAAIHRDLAKEVSET